MDLNNYLEESADLVYDKSKELCKHGIMDEDCFWYHSVWEYLRLFNMVSSPTWHDEFYKRELTNALLSSSGGTNILISGTADYSLLAYVIYSIKAINKNNVNIYVLDTCKTPLFACKWFAKKENFPIETINEDILKYQNDNYFDIICTDAFLTRFNKEIVPEVVNKWYELLKPNGRIITTVRIYESKTSKEEKDELIKKFKNEAKKCSLKHKDYLKFSPDDFSKMAETYAKKMISNNLGDEKSILGFFKNHITSYNTSITLGELKETKYIELVAKKPNR